jgi:hypothetical protein
MQTKITRDPETHLCVYDFSDYADFLPALWLESLSDYFNRGTEPGRFIRAVLENNLMGAIRNLGPKTQDKPISIIYLVLELLIEGAPDAAHGSPEKVSAWLQKWESDGIYGRAVAHARNSAPRALFEEKEVSNYGRNGH